MSIQFTDTNSPAQLQGKLFSPAQIMLGTILGGLVAGVYFLGKNYESIGDIQKRNMTYSLGLLLIIFIASLTIYFNLKIPGTALAAGLSAGLSAYTRTFLQENKIAIVGTFFFSIENKEILQSKWHVIGGMLIGIIAGVIIALSITFTFEIFRVNAS